MKRPWVRLVGRLSFRLLAVAEARPPDFIVGGGDGQVPYLRRWWMLPRNPIFNVYLHHFMRSDDDRALHDHPWPSVSLSLVGRMMEHTFAEGRRAREQRHERAIHCGLTPLQLYSVRPIAAGDIRFRRARFSHRLELPPGGECWTLFITGPSLRSWGFWCEGVRWVHWKIFTDTVEGASKVGRGCG